jgi:integrase
MMRTLCREGHMEQRRDRGTGNLVERSPGKWFIRVDYGTNALTGRRDRRSFVFEGTRRAAQRKLNELLAQRDAGLAPSPDTILVADWFRGWLARHVAEGHIQARSHERYHGIVEQHIVPCLGHVRVRDVRVDHIADVKAHWLKTLKPATVHKHFVVLRQGFDEAVAANLIARNPAAAVQAPSVIGGRLEQRALTEAEIGLLLEAAAGSRYDVPIRFTLMTGLREGELLALRWSDVDLKGGIVNLRGSKTANSRRRIELSLTAVRLLSAHRQAQRKRRLSLGPAWHENDLVFPSLIGTTWLRRPFYRDYRAIVDGSKLADPAGVTWHTLRHTAASQWLLHGADIFTVSRRLGHASAVFTMDTYAHLLKGQQKVAAEALDHLLAR